MNNKPQFQKVNNVQIGCTFCGANVHGRVNQIKNPKTNEIIKECRWVCGRCNHLVKIGNVE